MRRPTIGLDLGASYTKVSFRPAFPSQRPQRYVERPSELVRAKGEVLIPSVVLRTTRQERPWVCGRDAWGVTPGQGWMLHSNWKASLFDSDPKYDKDTLSEIVEMYARYLLRLLAASGATPSTQSLTRIAVPAFESIAAGTDTLRSAFSRAGWEGEIAFAREPAANVVGAFTRGRNVVTAAGLISYGPMFNSNGYMSSPDWDRLFGAIHAYFLGNRSSQRLPIMLVDLGAYTLDIALVTIDVKVTAHKVFPENSRAVSHRVGVVSHLDSLGAHRVLDTHGIVPSALSLEQYELLKRDVYASRPHTLAMKGRTTTLGSTQIDKTITKNALEQYCASAWAAIQSQMFEPELVVVTGGAAAITRIRKRLKARFAEVGVHHVLFAEDEQPMLRIAGTPLASPAGTGPQSLGRVATALGATSIALGFFPDPAAEAFQQPGVFW